MHFVINQIIKRLYLALKFFVLRKWKMLLTMVLILSLTYRIYNIGTFVIPIEIETTKTQFVLNTPQCKIPNLNPWDESILKFLNPDSDFLANCTNTSVYEWTYMVGKELIINTSSVIKLGYSTDNITCCYSSIHRVDQPLNDYNYDADNQYKYSDICNVMQERQEIDAEFIHVLCRLNTIHIKAPVVYHNFYAIAQIEGNQAIANKLLQTKGKKSRPNVVIIGIDNNSRMNSLRYLSKTRQYLQYIGAVELLGYTKVGENTILNTMAFYSGVEAHENMTDVPKCFHSDFEPKDSCPWIWKEFNASGYVTTFVEDMPYIGGFNYLRTGFLRKPVDFYFRPYMLATLNYYPRQTFWDVNKCIGSRLTEQVMLQYILDVVQNAEKANVPVLAHSWLTHLAHDNFNNLQFADEYITSFLADLKNTNTIFFFMSDHGARYGPIRQTRQGWYEDKLPMQWVFIPPNIRNLYPEWYSALQLNSKRLTSHLDLYYTFQHILHTFDKTENLENDNSQSSVNAMDGRPQSLFMEILEYRTCDMAGIPVSFCACAKPEKVDKKNQDVIKAAETALSYLTKALPKEVCATPHIKSVESAERLDLQGKEVYVITFVTNPGDFIFEATIIKQSYGLFVIETDLLRKNKISRAADCVNSSLLQRYCYCL